MENQPTPAAVRAGLNNAEQLWDACLAHLDAFKIHANPAGTWAPSPPTWSSLTDSQKADFLRTVAPLVVALINVMDHIGSQHR